MQIKPIVFKLQKLLKSSLEQDAHYLLAVSGGADSLALAHACAALAKKGWGTYSVCHVEHGLRGAEALRDMRLVESFCREQGLSCCVKHVDVRTYAQKEHLSTEDAARRLRYRALRSAAKEAGASLIVTAHHMGDQAETVLLRLMRGAGLEGLAAMRAKQGDILRPLLGVERGELEAYCQAQGLAYCHDSTNDDVRYTRNRVRRELLRDIAQQYNPDIVPALARTAALLALDADFMEAMAKAFFDGLAKISEGQISLRLDVLLSLHKAVRLRVLRKAYYKLSSVELDYERTLALEALCVRRSGGKLIQLPGAVTAACQNKQIIFTQNNFTNEH